MSMCGHGKLAGYVAVGAVKMMGPTYRDGDGTYVLDTVMSQWQGWTYVAVQ